MYRGIRFSAFAVKSINQKIQAIPHGHNDHSLLRHTLLARLHDRPHHHEDHAGLLAESVGRDSGQQRQA